MRQAILAIGGAVLLGSSAAAAPVFISPVHCPRGTGATHDPFYDVTAIQDMMPGPGAPKPLRVRGQYRIGVTTGRLVLHEADYGKHSHLLRLDLRRVPGPRIRNRCMSFSGSFQRQAVRDVSIMDSRGRSIRVRVDRPR
jgi:hypothetical protein